MSAMCTLILFVLLAIFALLVGYARYRAPLLRIPCAHPTSSFSGLWILWKRYQGGGQELAAVQAAHRRHGTLVRLGPQEVSIASVKDVRRLLQREEKHIWHKAFANFGLPNCMSSLDYRSHAAQRRCAMRPYVKARLQESERLRSIVETILLDRLAGRLASEQSPVTVDVVSLCFATVMDVVTGHAFGLALAPDLLGDDNKRLLYQRAHYEASAQRPMFWAQELPLLCSMLPQPSRVTGAKSFLESMVLSLCMQANALCCRQTEGSLSPSLYRVIRDELHRHSPAMAEECLERKVASELLDHFKAASDVLSITLVHAMHELSRNQPAQDELRSELRAMWQPDHRWLPQAKHLDQLPYLDAVVCETLRLRPTTPDGQPRVTRSAVPTENGTVIPRDTRISTYLYVLHHDEHVFLKAHEWTPERWMDSGLKPNEHLWAFGVGPRACLGRNMAITIIKYFLAFTYQSHRTELRDASKWRQRDGDFANLDDALWLTVTRYE